MLKKIYKEYKFLVNTADKSRNKKDVLFDNYPIINKDMLVFRKEEFIAEGYQPKRTYLIMNIDKFMEDKIQKLLFTPNNNLCFHEVVIADKFQKIRFDIDIDIEKYTNDKIPTIDHLYNSFKDAIYNEIIGYVSSSMFLNQELEEYLLVFDSSDNTKLSLHIVLNYYYCTNQETAKYLCNRIIDTVLEHNPDYNSEWFDTGIYNKNSTLRLYNNKKIKSNRIKKLYNCKNIPAYNTLITYVEEIDSGFRLSLDIDKDIKYDDFNNNIIMDKDDITRLVEDLIDSDDKYNGIISLRHIDSVKNIALTKRECSSFCSICNRNHDNDNTIYFVLRQDLKRISNIGVDYTINNSLLEINIYEKCMRDSKKSIFVKSAKLTPTQEHLDYFNKRRKEKNELIDIATNKYTKKDNDFITRYNHREYILKDTVQKYNNKNYDKLSTMLSDKYIRGKNIKIHEYEKPSLEDFPDDFDTLFVIARMKMGKTKTLRNFIQKINGDHKILFLSFRQTFSQNIMQSFENLGFESYKKYIHDRIIISQRLIIQIESLYKYYLQDNNFPYLLVMDESESIIGQLTSNLSKDPSGVYRKFEALLKYSKKVICMDAYMTDRTAHIIKEVREPAVKDHKLLIHNNTYKNSTDDKYYVTYNNALWLQILHEKLGIYTEIDKDNGVTSVHYPEKQHKVVIMSSSLKEAKALHDIFTSYFEAQNIKLNVGFYSSETSKKEKDKVFGDVNTYWDDKDILIFTPTVSAGVSFEIQHYDYVFCYFTNLSCNVQTCLQMMGRIRNIGKKEYYICFNGLPIYKPTSYDRLKSIIEQDNREIIDSANINYIIDRNGRNNIIEDIFFHIWIQNELVNNISKRYFTNEFMKFLRYGGGTIISLVDFIDNLEDKELVDKYQILRTHFYNKMKNTKSLITEIEYHLLKNANFLDDFEFEKVVELDSNNKLDTYLEDKTKEERDKFLLQYKKTALFDFYNVPKNQEDKLTTSDIKIYNNSRTKKLYLLYSDYFRDYNVDKIHSIILNNSKDILKTYIEVSNDLIPTNLLYSNHIILVQLLKLLDITHIFPDIIYSDGEKNKDIPLNDTLFNNLKQYVINNADNIKQKYDLQKLSDGRKIKNSSFFSGYNMESIDRDLLVKIIKQIFKVYDINIHFTKKENTISISSTDLFKLNHSDDNKLFIPVLRNKETDNDKDYQVVMFPESIS